MDTEKTPLIEAGFQQIPGDVLKLMFRVRKDMVVDSPFLDCGTFSIEEILHALGSEAEEAARQAGVPLQGLMDARQRFVLVNGWQSWSFAGELSARERPRRAFYKRVLNLFVDHPAEDALRTMAGRGASWLGAKILPRGAFISHHFLILRYGQLRLALVSDNTDPSRMLPPLSFILQGNRIRIAAYAEGGHFRCGDMAGRVAVLAASDYFSLKERLARTWDSERRLSQLQWLAPSGLPVGGYASWYNHYTAIDEHIIGHDLEAIGTNDNLVNALFLQKGKPAVFQIDDGWQIAVGDWEPHQAKFPAGMKTMADRIRARGLVPGIWLAPFLVMPQSRTAQEHPDWVLHNRDGKPVLAGWNPNWAGDVWCLDLSLPQVREYLGALFNRVVNEWGYRYLKLDFLYAGMMRGAFAGDPGGAWQHYARTMQRILEYSRAKDGTPAAFLSCGAPIEMTAPYMPLMRSGADTREHWDWWQLRLIGHQGRPSAAMNMRDSIGRALLNRALLWCDPDVVFCRTVRISLTDTEKFLVGMVAWMFGSQIMISDDPAAFGQVQPEKTAGRTEAGVLGEAAFTAQLADWYARIERHEFGVERLSPRLKDVYYFYSRDGSVRGAINLSDREVAVPIPESGRGAIEAGQAASLPDAPYSVGGYPLPAHSMLIFGA